MTQVVLRSLALGLLLATGLVTVADAADPRENLDTAIADAIRLLEKKEYKEMLKRYVDPKDLEKVTANTPLDEFAEQFGSRKAEQLLLVLKSIQGTKPMLDKDGTEATFQPKMEVSKRSIKFGKVDKLWYIRN